MNLKRPIYYVVTLFLITVVSCGQSEKVTMEKLLDEMISFDAPTEYPVYTCHQESSYDRRSVSPGKDGWFANNDGFGIIRTDTIDGRLENVLFDQTGAGVITRVWITTLNKNGIMRFYFDGNTEAGWTIPAYDMVKFGIPIGRGLLQPHTSYIEGGKGGSTFFLPIPYAKSCKVTFENPVGEKETPKYYHFNFRKYPEGTSVETFSQEVADRVKDKIEKVSNTLLSPPTYKAESPLKGQKELGEQEQISLTLPQGKNAIRTIEISIDIKDAAVYAQAMRELMLEAAFDGIKTVSAPLSDFSGGGIGAPLVESWYLSADGKGNVISRWVMPYQQDGTVTLTNYSSHTINASLTVHTAPFDWKKNTLYFHSAWKQENNIPLTNNEKNDCIDWNFTTLKGKGVYMGDVLSLFNHSPAWYGEGDEKIFVDDETFPSHFGTGTEDYYNSSWAPVVPFHTPFGGAPRADLESSHGYNTFFRTRNLDGIPFQKQLRFDIEMISWQDGAADYATTVFWYGDLSSLAKDVSGIEEVKRELLPAPKPKEKYKIAGAIEFENLAPIEKSSSITADVQNMEGFTSDKWSNDKQLLCVGGQEGDYVTFRFDNLKPKKYDILVYMTKAGDYGIVKYTVNGKPTSVSFDGYSTGVKNSKAIKLGTFTPEEGHFDLKIELSGTNKNTTGNRYFIGLDCVQLIEK